MLTNNYNEGLDNKVIGGVYVITGSCLGFLLCRVSLSLNNIYNGGLDNKVRGGVYLTRYNDGTEIGVE